MAKLVSVRQKPKHRALGSAKGMFWMSDDFDAPLPPEIENSFWK